MDPKGRSILSLVCLIFLWRTCNVSAYDGGICEELHMSIYCTCQTRYAKTTIVCFITNQLSIHDDIWQSLTDVENVSNIKLQSMPNWKLDYIPIESLREMNSLHTLSIKEANLGSLTAGNVSGLKQLQELEMEGCEITSLGTNSISELPKLRKLSLSDNSLQEILADSLVGLDELETLFCDNNNISRIETCAFCDLHNLKDLGLVGNQITDLTDYMFRGLRYLKRLDLYSNKIRILNDNVFQSMPRLVELDLRSNLISHIARHAFDGLEKLQTLILTSNKIAILPDEVFKFLPNLRSLDLYNNELETLQEEVVKNMANFKESHFSMVFKENPFKCDCRLQWVKSYLKISKSNQFNRELRELKCRANGENETLQTVHSLQMDCDKSMAINTREQSTVTNSRSVTQPVNLVPYEIQGRKNKTRKIPSVTEEVSLLQDVEPEREMADEMEKDGGPSASTVLSADMHFIVCAALLTVLLVRKRKGTL